MADKSAVIHKTQHEHCEVCGACFIAGITKAIHKCPEAIDLNILAVFLADSERLPARSVRVPISQDRRT